MNLLTKWKESKNLARQKRLDLNKRIERWQELLKKTEDRNITNSEFEELISRTNLWSEEYEIARYLFFRIKKLEETISNGTKI